MAELITVKVSDIEKTDPGIFVGLMVKLGANERDLYGFLEGGLASLDGILMARTVRAVVLHLALKQVVPLFEGVHRYQLMSHEIIEQSAFQGEEDNPYFLVDILVDGKEGVSYPVEPRPVEEDAR